MEYFRRIRQKIGHDPLFLPSAGVIIYRDGQILLQKRADNGMWAIHGGAMDLGETTEEAARRELLEEIGLTAVSLELYGVYSGEEMHSVLVNGDEIYVVATIYFCDDFTGKIRLDPNEVVEAAWFDLESLSESIITPPDGAALRDLPRFVKKKYGG